MEPDSDALVDDTTHLQQNPVRSYDSLESLAHNVVAPNKLPQYAAAISSTFAAMAAGITLGWTSPIKSELEAGLFNNISVNDNQMGWIGSITTIGAMLSCIPTGFVCDAIGRKTTLLLLLLPFILGWLLVIFAKNLAMLYSGRFITGIACGACCVAVPMYIGEISHKDVRGTLGSYFQLMVTMGILYAYIIGAFGDLKCYTALCAVPVLAFGVTFLFPPESPLYYLKIGQAGKAKKALKLLRGPNFNCNEELVEMERTIRDGEASMGLWRAFQQRACRRATYISLWLMFFQQVSGINVIIFYTSDIFANAGVNLDPRYCSIIVGICQVAATYVSSRVVDKLGRRPLLISSALLMGLAMMLLATFFFVKSHHLISNEIITKINFLPVIFLVLYIVAFSVGFGPIPWMINGEIFSPEVKAVASSLAGTVNWFFAFAMTKSFLELDKMYEGYGLFYWFGITLLSAALYVWYAVLETKGKSIAEIQFQLEHFESTR